MTGVQRPVQLHGLLKVRQALVSDVEERRAALVPRGRLFKR